MPARTRSSKPPEPPADEAEDTGGFFRNTGTGTVTVLADVTAVLEPGRIARFGRTPTHRDLAEVSEADYAAQQAADAAAATEPADDAETAAAESTEKTEE
jgi:hypothetical protein